MDTEGIQFRRRRRRRRRDIERADESSRAGSSRRRTRRRRRAIARLGVVGLGGAALALAATLVFDHVVGRYGSQDYETALGEFRARRYEDAAVQLEQILSRDHNNLSARILLGRTYLRLGYAERAEESLRRALGDGADRRIASVPLALAYLEQGKFERIFEELPATTRDKTLRGRLLVVHGRAHLAMRALQRAERAFDDAAHLLPESAGPHLGAARVALARGAFAAAAGHASDAAERAPDDPEVWHVRGEIRRAQRDLDGAVAAYGEALARAPHHLRSRLSRAGALVQLDRDDEAIEDLRAVWAVRPDDAEANYYYALVLSKLGKLDEAQALIERAALGLMSYRTEFVMRHPPSLLLMGVLHFRKGRYEQAFPLLDRYVQLEPHNVGARKLLGTVMLVRDLPAAAIDTLEPALELAPEDPELLAMLAQALTQKGEPQRAAPLLARAAELAPERAGYRSQLALTRLATGAGAEDEGGADEGLDLGTSDEGTGVLVGMLRLRDGNVDVALEIARTLAEQRPHDAVIANLLGAVGLAAGRHDDARHSLERALGIDPRFAPAHRNLARLAAAEGDARAARERLLALVERDPGDTRAMVLLADMARDERRRGETIEWLERAREADSDDVGSQLDLVEAYVAAQRIEPAQTLVADLSERFPHSIPVRVARGRVELAAGNRDKASATFREVTREASSAERLYRLVEYQIAVNDVEGARESLEKIVAADPEFMPAHERLVALDLEGGDPKSALARAAALRERQPRRGLGYRLYGEALLHLGRTEDAARAFAAGMEREASGALAVHLFRARSELGDLEAAIAELEAWTGTHPDDADARRVLAEGLIEAGRTAEALAEHERLAEAHPDDALVLSNLARLYALGGDPRALETAERAFELAPKSAEALDALGWVLVVDDGDPARALKYLRDARNRAAADPRIGYHIAVALARLGRHDEARRELRRALDGERRFAGADDARRLLAELER